MSLRCRRTRRPTAPAHACEPRPTPTYGPAYMVCRGGANEKPLRRKGERVPPAVGLAPDLARLPPAALPRSPLAPLRSGSARGRRGGRARPTRARSGARSARTGRSTPIGVSLPPDGWGDGIRCARGRSREEDGLLNPPEVAIGFAPSSRGWLADPVRGGPPWSRRGTRRAPPPDGSNAL